jgi:hypothetical protein
VAYVYVTGSGSTSLDSMRWTCLLRMPLGQAGKGDDLVELFGLDLYLIVGVGIFNLQRKLKSAAQARDVLKGASKSGGTGKGGGGANALLQIRRVKSLTRFCSPLYQAPPKTGFSTVSTAQPWRRRWGACR